MKIRKIHLLAILILITFSITSCGRISQNQKEVTDNANEQATESTTPVTTPTTIPTNTLEPTPTSTPTPTPETSSEPDNTNGGETEIIPGNTAGNIANGGYVATDGEYNYILRNYNNEYINSNDLKLFKEDIATGEMIKVFNEIGLTLLNVNGDWIYYLTGDGMGSIYRIKKDGTQNTEIIEGSIKYFITYGNFIYYEELDVNNGGLGGLFKATTDANNITKILDGNCYEFNVTKDWIYYTNWAEASRRGNSTPALYKCKHDGSEITKLLDVSARNIIVDGNYIYYINIDENNPDNKRNNQVGTLYRIDINGENNERILDKQLQSINICNDWIVYTGEQHMGLGKVKKDGTEDECLYDYLALGTNIIGDWIYFNIFDVEQPMKQYKMKIDGTEKQAIPKALEDGN